MGPSVLAALVLASASPPARAPPPSPSAEEALYLRRFTTMKAGGDVYDVMEAVPGAADPVALARARRPGVTARALGAARAYAAANRSTALLVWRDGALEAADYFGATTAKTLLVSKSLAKPLTAIVVGRAIRLGAIRDLDQPVSDFITEWRGGPKASMKIRHLLDMRSGLLAQGPMDGPQDPLARAYLSPRHDEVLIGDYPLTHPPGERFDYANAVADLVAIVIERATHERYARFVSEAVLKPLGAAGGEVWLDRPGGLAHSACCISLPAETWLRLAVLLIDDGRVQGRRFLPRGFVREMRTPTPQNPQYGLGVYLGEPYAERRPFGAADMPGPRVLQGEPYLARDLFLFDGNADQVVYMAPSARVIVLRTGEAPPAAPEWDNAVLIDTVLRGLVDPASATSLSDRTASRGGPE